MSKILVLFLFVCSVLFANDDVKKLGDLKKAIYTDIKKEFKSDFDIWGVDFDENTLAIRFARTKFLYKPGSTQMQRTFEVIIKDFYPRYVEYLLKYKKDIQEVVVVGHTSSESRKAKTKDGKYLRNLVLSQDRAKVVLDYMKQLDDDVVVNNKSWIDSSFRSIGVSSSKLIVNKDGKEDKKLSRRIEIEIKLVGSDSVDYSKSGLKKDTLKDIKLLSDYVKQLLVENPTINEQYQLLNAIKQDIEIAKAAFRPTVTLNYNLTKYSESRPDNQTDSQSKDITIKYNVFNGFKDESEKKIKEANYLTTKYTKEQIEAELIYSLSDAFIEIQKQKQVLSLAKKNLEDYDLWIAKEKIKFQNGLISLKDFAKINSRDTTQRMNYEELSRTYKDSISTFEKYVDFDIEDINLFEELNINSVYFKNKSLSLEDCVVFSPFVKEAQQNIVVYKEKMNKSKVNFYPIVDLIGKKSIKDEDFKSTASVRTEETTFALQANLNLYAGGADQADYEKKLFEYRQKIQKRDEVIRDIKYKVKLAYNKYELVKQKDMFLNKLVSQREESYVGANYDYKFAKIDANGLLDVVDDLYSAKKLYLENRFDILLAKYKILTDIGIIRENILDE